MEIMILHISCGSILDRAPIHKDPTVLYSWRPVWEKATLGGETLVEYEVVCGAWSL